jgi:hypothetical protein
MSEERVGKKKTQVSFTIRAEKEPRHHSGVSSIVYDPALDRYVCVYGVKVLET